MSLVSQHANLNMAGYGFLVIQQLHDSASHDQNASRGENIALSTHSKDGVGSAHAAPYSSSITTFRLHLAAVSIWGR